MGLCRCKLDYGLAVLLLQESRALPKNSPGQAEEHEEHGERPTVDNIEQLLAETVQALATQDEEDAA